jgi:hypothetical protein
MRLPYESPGCAGLPGMLEQKENRTKVAAEIVDCVRGRPHHVWMDYSMPLRGHAREAQFQSQDFSDDAGVDPDFRRMEARIWLAQ